MPLQVVKRIHLFEALNHANIPRVIVITAPAGCGKTVLAQQLVEHLGVDAIWHPLDTWQKDTTRLHQICRNVWQKYHPNLTLGENYETATGSARALTQAIQAHTSEATFYILDDIHHLQESWDAEHWLQTLIDTCPSNLHLIFIGHALPTINWYQEIGREHVLALDKTHLQFTTNDILQMTDIGEDEAKALVERYHGWATAIRLALDPTLQQIARHTLNTNTPENAVFKQLVTDFFQQQSLFNQQILLISSTTRDIPLNLYQEVFSLSTIHQYLEMLYQQHFLISKRDEKYQYHELFRDFLQEHLREMVMSVNFCKKGRCALSF